MTRGERLGREEPQGSASLIRLADIPVRRIRDD